MAMLWKKSQNLQMSLWLSIKRWFKFCTIPFFFCDTVYVKDYHILLRASNYLKLLALLATTSEQLVSIPVFIFCKKM